MRLTLPLLLGSLTAAGASAQTFTQHVQDGDAVAGVGNVTLVNTLAVNDFGVRRIEVDTDNANTDIDVAMLLDGVLELQEGQVLSGAILLDSIDTVNVPTDVTGGWNFFLDGTTGTSDDSGIYHGTNLLLQEGAISTSPDFDPGTPYIGFFECKARPGEILVMASIDDPVTASTTDRAIVRFAHDGAGTLISETVVAQEEDLLPGQTELVADFDTGPHSFDMNESGQVLFIADLQGDTTVDHVVYLDGTLLAQEGSPSPVAGRNWATLDSAEVDLNDFGGWVISGSLDGDAASNLLIEKNGAKFMQEGDSLPAIAPFVFTSFGTGPVMIANNGDVLWYGDWDDPDTTIDSGLFINDQLIVQEGVTSIGGQIIDTIRGITDGYTMSPNGQHILFRGQYDGAVDFAASIDRGGFQPFASCVANPGTLAHVAGVPAIGQSFDMAMDHGPAALSATFLAVANAPLATPPACGFTLPGGELMIGVAPPNPIVLDVGSLWSPGAPVIITEALPNDPGLVGRTFWTQGAFFNPGTNPTLTLTNALQLEIGE